MYIVEMVDKDGRYDQGVICKSKHNAEFYFNRQVKNNPNAKVIQLKVCGTNQVLQRKEK